MLFFLCLRHEIDTNIACFTHGKNTRKKYVGHYCYYPHTLRTSVSPVFWILKKKLFNYLDPNLWGSLVLFSLQKRDASPDTLSFIALCIF